MLPWGSRTFVMGILNATPDSFSGDGLMARSDMVAAAVEQAQRFAKAGADIATVPYKVIMQSLRHPLTDAGLEQFLSDYDKMQTERQKIISI